MPTARIGRRDVQLRRAAVRPYEAAWLLECSERDVRNMLRRGALQPAWAGRRRLVDVAQLAEVLGDDELALDALASVAEGHLRVPRDVAAQHSLSAAVTAAAGVQPASLTGALS